MGTFPFALGRAAVFQPGTGHGLEHLTCQPIVMQRAFSYGGPRVDGVEPAQLPTCGGTLRISGSNLQRATVRRGGRQRGAGFSDVECSVLESTRTHVTLRVEAGLGKAHRVLLGNASGTTSVSSGYEEPSITEVRVGDKPLETAGGQTVEVVGQNLGIGLPDELTVQVGGQTAKWRMVEEHIRLIVTLPPSNGGHQNLQVWVGQTLQQRPSSITPACHLRYDLPKVLSCTEIGRVGQIVTVGGSNFGSAGEIAVRIGGISCEKAQVSVRHTQISCQVPEGKGHNLPVEVCVNGQWSDPDNRVACFSYKVEGAPKRPQRIGPYVTPPSISEAEPIFKQWRLSTYYERKDPMARKDVHGNDFTKESVRAAQEAYKKLTLGLAELSEKKKNEILNRCIFGWQKLKAERGLTEAPAQKRARTTA
ncbi:hypothetical protein KFL_000380375 [Klebsormidium nitens]|uniref:IPT/TIG domain-containing protein n=1 Tax=Klebsormidium nitens TaxID=105231 RepID=A0A1Y1HTF0_KLENI|nr:hypothetical protein KFL_000380375 [Klebsormidium nitens]|eukprot:GAQ79806.1 hypothetical protein KFL_000380375 [Klebsormidium nitens]